MTRLRRGLVGWRWLWAATVGVCACGGGGSDGSTGTWPDEGALACEAPPCHFLLATASLDDRIEVFEIAGTPEYRATVDFDLDPNPGGDYSEDRLDEPYEAAVLGGDLVVPVGHFPARNAGSVAFLPLALLADLDVGGHLPADAYFDGADGIGGAVLAPAGAQEAIFTTPVAEGLLVTAVENDLFAAEDTWTRAGAALLLAAGERGEIPAPRPLDDLPEGACAAAGESVLIDERTVAVACDGNEAVAFYERDGDDLAPLALCNLPPASGARVRYLAADGGAAYVAESPTTASPDPARLWRLDPTCSLGAVADVMPAAAGTLTDVAAVPGAVLVAGTLGRRGIHPVRTSDGAPETCPPLAGLDELWVGADGRDLEPVALAALPDGTRLAVAVGPFLPAPDDPGYGRIYVVDLVPGACGPEVAGVVDLTDGGPGHAAAVTPADPSTYRRMAGPLTVHTVEAADLDRAP